MVDRIKPFGRIVQLDTASPSISFGLQSGSRYGNADFAPAPFDGHFLCQILSASDTSTVSRRIVPGRGRASVTVAVWQALAKAFGHLHRSARPCGHGNNASVSKRESARVT